MSKRHKAHDRNRWEHVRRNVFTRDGYRCTSCGMAGQLECDHVTPLEDKPDQDFYALTGLQALCRSCHIEKTRRERLRREQKKRRKERTPGELAWRELVQEMMD